MSLRGLDVEESQDVEASIVPRAAPPRTAGRATTPENVGIAALLGGSGAGSLSARRPAAGLETDCGKEASCGIRRVKELPRTEGLGGSGSLAAAGRRAMGCQVKLRSDIRPDHNGKGELVVDMTPPVDCTGVRPVKPKEAYRGQCIHLAPRLRPTNAGLESTKQRKFRDLQSNSLALGFAFPDAQRHVASPVQKKKEGFNGRWMDHDGQRLRATIDGQVLAAPGHENVNLRILSSTTCALMEGGEVYTGELMPNGTLQWSDGEIWSRQVKGVETEQNQVSSPTSPRQPADVVVWDKNYAVTRAQFTASPGPFHTEQGVHTGQAVYT